MQETKILLSEKEVPRQWYNIMADMPNLPKPPLHPGTREPIGPNECPGEKIKESLAKLPVI